MFIEALLMIARSYKQAKHISPGEWITKLWYIETMEYCTALKRNELSSHEKKETNKILKYILLNEKNVSQKMLLYESSCMTF